MKLQPDFYCTSSTKSIAKNLLGKFLVTCIDGKITSGIITETEAYEGVADKACHSYGNRYTERTRVMYEKGGVAYVYLCYGLHNMFNVVTQQKGDPQAILIRAIHPVDGIELMEKRRALKAGKKGFSGGPGTVCKALGITREHNTLRLDGKTIWIEEREFIVPKRAIHISKRIGIDYAAEDTHRLNRFVLDLKSL